MTKRLRRLRKPAMASGVLAICFVAFVSQHFFYLSHDRFGVLAYLQLNLSDRPTEPRRPQIIGHRGSGRESTASGVSLVGNTRTAISNAIEAEVDWIEIDVRKTAGPENALAVFHDEEISKRTNGKGKVEELDMTTLQSHDVSVKRVNGQPERILSLDQVFTEFKGDGKRWILDIKSKGIRETLLRLIKKHRIPIDQIMIFGERSVLEEYRGVDHQLGYTTLFGNHLGMLFSCNEVLEHCDKNSYDKIVVPIVFVTQDLIDKAGEKDIEVWSYDTNDPRDFEHCIACGVAGLVVDHPQYAKGQVKSLIPRNL